MTGCQAASDPPTGYDRLTMHVFSGTGNTLRAARWMAEAAEQAGVPATIQQIVGGAPPQPPGGSAPLVGLLTPTHGFTAPWWMIRFALRLPRGRGTHAFVAVTRGSFLVGGLQVPGIEGTAGYLLALLLLLRGYRVRGVLALDMPVNWTAVHSALSAETVRILEERARGPAVATLQRLLAGRRAFGGWLFLALGLLLLPVSVLYLLMGRFFLAKLFFANSACNGCGLCARQCPVGAIRLLGRRHPRPYWTYSCESCMRCMACCPRKAVEAGHSWAVLLYFAGSIPAGWFAASWLSHWSPWLQICGTYPVKLAAIALAYLLFCWLLRLRPVNALFTWTTLTHFYRRYHEPETRLIELQGAVRKPAGTT